MPSKKSNKIVLLVNDFSKDTLAVVAAAKKTYADKMDVYYVCRDHDETSKVNYFEQQYKGNVDGVFQYSNAFYRKKNQGVDWMAGDFKGTTLLKAKVPQFYASVAETLAVNKGNILLIEARDNNQVALQAKQNGLSVCGSSSAANCIQKFCERKLVA